MGTLRNIQAMISYLHCMRCGKQVSTGFESVPTDTPDKGIIVRAFIECPECMEKRFKDERIAWLRNGL